MDPRIDPSQRPEDSTLDESYLHQLAEHHAHVKSEKNEKGLDSREDTDIDETIYVGPSMCLVYAVSFDPSNV